MSADLARLGDALDAEESAWDAAHPDLAGQALLWSTKVDKAFARYRKAARAEVTTRRRKPSKYAARIARMTFPDSPTSLRQSVDAEARDLMTAHAMKLQRDYIIRVARKHAKRQRIRRAVARRRSLGLAC